MNKKSTTISFLILFLISLTPLLWFKGSLVIAGGDTTLYLNPTLFTKKIIYTWRDALNLGTPNNSLCFHFPIGIFWVSLHKLNLSNVTIEKLWFIFIWFLSSFSIYKLTIYVTSSLKYSLVAGIFAAILYQFNTFKMIEVLNWQKQLTYMVLPLMLYFFIKGLDCKKNIYAISFALSTLLFSSAWANPPAAIIAFVPIVLYFLYHILFLDTNKGKTIFFAGKACILLVVINLWWIIPFILSLSGTIESTKERAGYFSPSGTKTLEVFRFMGLWAFRSGHYLMSYFPYNGYFYNSPLVLLSYLIPLIAFSPLLYFRNLDKKIFFFYCLLIIGNFLTIGKHPPFGFLYSFLYRNLPGFWIFREPYAKFTPLNTLSISILFGITVMYFFHFLDKKVLSSTRNMICKTASSFALTGIVLTTSFPLLTGDCIWKYWNGSMRSSYVDIPKYWFGIGEWLKKNDPHSRIFTVPKATYGHAYNWESGVTVESMGLSIYFIPNSYLIYNHMQNDFSGEIINFTYDEFLDFNKNLVDIVPLLGVKYVLQKNDLDWNYAFKDTYPPPIMKKILTSQDSINHVESFGKLDLYEIAEERYLPPIYGSAY